MPTPILQLTDVTKRYAPPEGGRAIDVLRGVSLAVQAGQTVAITGPSGCGKSTLLNLMGTLDRPTSGQVLLDGTDLARLDDRELARTRNQHIGFVFQMHHLLPQCSALENVLVPTLVHSSAAQRRDAEARALRLLERVGLAQRTHHRPAQLSGGEQQRVAVVRALINGPGLLLADEPTGSLDEAAAEQLADLIVELNREEGVTLIVVTHTPAVAQRMGLCYDMRRGALMTAGGAS